MRRAAGWTQEFFEVEGYRVSTYHRARPGVPTTRSIDTEATVKVWVGGERLVAVGEGNGPVNALDAALRGAARRARYPRSSASTSPTTRCACSTAGPPPARSCGC